jgi:hypothetical protein
MEISLKLKGPRPVRSMSLLIGLGAAIAYPSIIVLLPPETFRTRFTIVAVVLAWSIYAWFLGLSAGRRS